MEVKSASRRMHGDELKAEVIAACRTAGASVAAVARSHGLNANLVHKWLRNSALSSAPHAAAVASVDAPREPAGFVELHVSTPVPAVVAPLPDIRIELRRGATTVNVSWPGQTASECAAWLREWLR